MEKKPTFQAFQDLRRRVGKHGGMEKQFTSWGGVGWGGE
jgi:hypothetical protein